VANIQKLGIYYEKKIDVFNLFVSNIETREVDPFDKAGLFILRLTEIYNQIDKSIVEDGLCIAPKMVDILLSHLVNEGYLTHNITEYTITQKGLRALEEEQLYKQDIEDFEYLTIEHLNYVIPPYCNSLIERNFKKEIQMIKINFEDMLKNKSIYNIPEKWYNKTDASKQISQYYGNLEIEAKLCFEESNEYYEFMIWPKHIINDHPELEKVALKFPDLKQISHNIKDYLKNNILYCEKFDIVRNLL